MFQLIALCHLALMVSIPGIVLAALLTLATGPFQTIAATIAGLPLAAVAFALTAAALSLPYQSSVRPGKMLRDVNASDYRARRLYGLCWTSLYYCKFAYYAVLAVPPLRHIVLRLFGYRGAGEFTTYPDTWIRDLPLLDIGRGAYLSNRATIGTNVVLSNGHILVDRVSVGAGAVVGHLAMIGPGVVVEDDAEIGVGAGIGFSSRVGQGARIGPKATIEHGVQIGPGARIGAASYIGNGCVIGAAVTIPAGAVIPARTRIMETPAGDSDWRPRLAV